MFNQNVLIVNENNQLADDFLVTQLLNIGYQPAQLFRANVYPQETETEYEIIIINTHLLEDISALSFRLSEDWPEIPVVVIAEKTSKHAVLPVDADDWLLKSWLQPELLKKTLQLAIERKKNTCNYVRIFRENPNPMYIYDKETFRFLQVNTAALRQYGYTKEEFLQLTANDIRPATEIAAFHKINKELPATYSNAGIWHHTRKNGETFYTHIFTHQIIFEGVTCKLVMALDIDEAFKAEQLLKKKNREIENILESITDGFFTVSKNWEFTYMNKEFERIVKRTREDLTGKNLWVEFPNALKLEFYSQYQKAIRENVSVHFESYYAPLCTWLAINAYPTETGLAVYLVDVTQQKNYQQKIESQNKQFKEIAWVQAHQIRGPVSNLLGLVDLFNIKQPADPSNLELLDRVKHTAIQMDESIKEIVTLTRKLEAT